LLAAFALGAAALALRGGHGGAPLVPSVLAFVFAVSAYVFFLTTSVARDLRLLFLRQPVMLVAVVLVPVAVYLLYALGNGTFSAAAAVKVLGYAAVPTVMVAFAGNRAPGVALWDVAAMAALWLPFDAGWLKDIWTWPAGGGAYIFNTALAVGLAVVLFQAWRGVPGLNVRLSMTRDDWRTAGLGLLVFLAIAVPFGAATDFIAWRPVAEPARYLFVPFAIFFFIALPEELLFRGLLQTFLKRWLKDERVTLVVTAVLFGATHLNNAGAGGQAGPDWRYFVLASVAGVIYGWIYLRTRRLTAAAVTHAAVDAVWVLLLHV